MNNYSLLDILAPWVTLVAIVMPLVYAERWIHQHLFGIGYLLSKKNEMAATRLFYVFFLPGVVIHEVIQYLVAGAINAPIKQVIAWPEKQANGTLRLDFISVQRDKTDPIRAAIVAASPFILMSFLIWYISTQQLALDQLAASLGSGDIRQIWASIEGVFGTSNFILWLYLLFVIANSMVPKKEDAHGLPIILGLLGILVAAMLVVGLDQVLIETLGGSIANTLRLINTALGSILGLNLVAILILGLIEDTIERIRGEKMNYSGHGNLTRVSSQALREPGSDLPYPKGQPLPSIYNMGHMPLPAIPKDGKPLMLSPAAEPPRSAVPMSVPSPSLMEAQRSASPSGRPSEGRIPLPSSSRGTEGLAPAPMPATPGGFTRSRRVGAPIPQNEAPQAADSAPSTLPPAATRPPSVRPGEGVPPNREAPASGGFNRPRQLGSESGENAAARPPSVRPGEGMPPNREAPASGGFSRPRQLGNESGENASPARPGFSRPGENPSGASTEDATERRAALFNRREAPADSREQASSERPARPTLDRSAVEAARPAPLGVTRPSRPFPRPGMTEPEPDDNEASDDDISYEDFDDSALSDDDF